MTDRERYFECLHCHQVVQGYNAMLDIECCEQKNMVEIEDEDD